MRGTPAPGPGVPPSGALLQPFTHRPGTMARRAAPARRREAARLFTRVVIALPLVCALGLLAWMGLFASTPAEKLRETFRLQPGHPVPYVQLTDAAGGSTTLAEVVRAGRRLVVVMDDECPHCHDELRMLEALGASGQLPAASVAVVSVSRQPRYPGLAGRYPGLGILNDVNGAFRGKLRLAAVPGVVVVGPDGLVAYVRFCLQTPPQLLGLARSAGIATGPAPPR